MPRIRLDERVANTRHTVRKVVNIVRDAVGDIVERAGPNLTTEPHSTRNLGGFLGHRGSLVKTIPHAGVRIVDAVVGHQQNFARINREHLHRRR